MKIAPPIYLMRYIEFKDGKVVPAKPLPFYLKPAFNRYCKRVEAAKKRRQAMFNMIKED